MEMLLFLLVIIGVGCEGISKRFYNYNPPEIIINHGDGGYLYPMPPVQLEDEIPQPPQNEYLPPPIPTPPQNEYLPPPLDHESPNNNYLLPVIPTTRTSIKILNMSCLNGNFFKSSLQSKSFLYSRPVTGNSNLNCGGGSNEIYSINLETASQLNVCGVYTCYENFLCLQLRVPSVVGLKLPEDLVVTLQCKPQSTTASQTRHLSFRPQIIKGRSLGSIAVGGSQRSLETQVAIYRRKSGSNDFTEIVEPGSAVNFGEDLMIRATVKDGDGWKFSKMSSVIMQQSEGTGTTLRKSITMVDGTGCRLINMKSVCPEHPKQINPLVTTMQFRAFMFSGIEHGDMLMTVRMTACLHKEDCVQADHCEEKVHGRIRTKRETTNGTSDIKDWESYFDFKVVLPKVNKPIRSMDLFIYTALYMGFTFFLLATIYILFKIKIKRI